MLKRSMREEQGMAMVVALLVTFVVLLLSIFVVEISMHNSTQSAYDRKRTQSVDAAEAGINYTWSTIEGTAPQSLPWGSPTVGTMSNAPATSTYSVDVTYYAADGSTLLTRPSQSNVPSSVLITSTGTTDGGVVRKMQSFASLTPSYAGIGAAILTNTGTALQNNFTLNGNAGSDADIYVLNGDLNITNAPTIYGNIYVPTGAYSASNNSTVYGDVWAQNAVSISNPSRVIGNAISSTSTVGGSGAVGQNATAGTTIAAGLSVSGSRYPNSPQGPPPTQAFPYVCFDNTVTGVCTAQSASWTSLGYSVQSFSDCASAKTYLTTGTIPANRIVRITAVCDLAMNSTSVNFAGNLAVITNGSITMSNLNDWNGPAGGGSSLFLLANYQGQTATQCATGSYNVTTGNNSNFYNAKVSLYSPCSVNVANLNTFSGQIIGGTVATQNNFTLNFVPVLIPGAASFVTGFRQSIQYIREVA